MNATLRKQILEVATYHSDDGTSGYLLNDEQIDKILALADQHYRGEIERAVALLRKDLEKFEELCQRQSLELIKRGKDGRFV